jgi:hypothetical protein
VIDDSDASIQIALAWPPGLEDPAVGRFVAFLRDQRTHDAFSEVGGARRILAKARSVAMNRASVGPTSFAGSTAPWPVSPASAWP